MFSGRTIAVVIPALNEARHIAQVIRTLPAFVDRIIVVDDASNDATAERAQSTSDPRVLVLRHPTNRGVGAAIATGYRCAFDKGADVAVVMAGDGQMDPANLVVLLEAVEGGADYAKGNRLAWPRVWRDMPAKRLAGNLVLSWLTRRAVGIDVNDSQCGYTALTRSAAARLDLHELWPRYGYPNDLIARLAESGARIDDVPVRAVYRDEESGVSWRDALVVVPQVLTRAWLRRRWHPRSEPVKSSVSSPPPPLRPSL